MASKKPTYTVVAQPTEKGEWQLVLRAPNGRAMMLGVRTYPTKFSAERAALAVGSAQFVPRPREKAE